jgi:hypothetical protein
MRISLAPGTQISAFEEAPRAGAVEAQDYRIESLDSGFAMALDLIALETRCQMDHEFLRRNGAARRPVVRNGQRIGYFYSKSRRIAPVASFEQADRAAILALACAEAASAGTISLRVRGLNQSSSDARLFWAPRSLPAPSEESL